MNVGKKEKERIPMTVRVSLPSLALIVSFLEGEGISVKSRSEAVDKALNVLADTLIENDKGERPSFERAVKFLESRGLGASKNTPADRKITLTLGQIDKDRNEQEASVDVNRAVEEYKERMRKEDNKDKTIDKKSEMLKVSGAPIVKDPTKK